MDSRINAAHHCRTSTPLAVAVPHKPGLSTAVHHCFAPLPMCRSVPEVHQKCIRSARPISHSCLPLSQCSPMSAILVLFNAFQRTFLTPDSISLSIHCFGISFHAMNDKLHNSQVHCQRHRFDHTLDIGLCDHLPLCPLANKTTDQSAKGGQKFGCNDELS